MVRPATVKTWEGNVENTILDLSPGKDFMTFFVFCWPWHFWITGQVVCKISFSLGLLNIFLKVRQGFWTLEIKTKEETCHSYHILSRVHNVNMIHPCGYWPIHVSVMCGYSVLLACHTIFFGRKLCTAHTWGIRVLLYFLESTALA